MYSQKDYPEQLGKCKGETIARSGCFLCSFCNLLKELGVKDITPLEFNKIAYPTGCMANAQAWANLFKLTYKKTTEKPDCVCIAETNYYQPSVPQHFFLWRPDGMIVDPLNKVPTWKKSKYPIVSYRVFGETKVPKNTYTPMDDIKTPVEPPVTPQSNPGITSPIPIGYVGYEGINPNMYPLTNFNLSPMKNLIQSRTFWLATIQGLLGVVTVVATQYPELGLLVIVKSALDIALRLSSTTAIK